MAIIETAFSLRQRAEDRDDLRLRQAVAGRASGLDLDKIAVAGAVAEFVGHFEFGLAAFDRRRHAMPAATASEDAERGVGALLEHLHDPRGVGGAGLSSLRKVFASTRSPTPGAGPRPALRGLDRDDHRCVACVALGRRAPADRRRRRARRCRAPLRGAGCPAASAASCPSRSVLRRGDRSACPSARRDPRPSARRPAPDRACRSCRDFPRYRQGGLRGSAGNRPPSADARQDRRPGCGRFRVLAETVSWPTGLIPSSSRSISCPWRPACAHRSTFAAAALGLALGDQHQRLLEASRTSGPCPSAASH